MKLLLHTCCAPCVIYPLEKLKQEGFSVRGYFYNPNIHPLSEYNNRLKAATDFGAKRDLEMVHAEYAPVEFFQAVNLKEDRPERCLICWKLRLKKTAEAAKEMGCEYFSTTLLVSPYQDQEALKKIGCDMAADSGVEFLYEDFRPGFRKAHEQAKAEGIYCQKYCGCTYSELERCQKSEKH